MIDKARDIPFEMCSHTMPEIEGAFGSAGNPEALKLLSHFIKERWLIYCRRASGQPAPWTSDPILRDNRFTNVFRELDRETLNLIHAVIENPELSLLEKQANCILFRSWNLGETFRKLGGPWTFTELEPGSRGFQRALETASRAVKEHPDHSWNTSAFIVSGNKMGIASALGELADQIPRPVHALFLGPWALGLLRDRERTTAREEFETLKKLPGISNFLAYQIWVDWTYIPEYPFSENHFTVAGPGCIKGLGELFPEYPPGFSPEEGIHYLVQNQESLLGLSPNLFKDRPSYDQRVNLMAMENCLCEFSKYARLHRGDPMKRRSFAGGPTRGGLFNGE